MQIIINPLAALKKIRPNDRIFIGSGAALPEGLIESLVANAKLFNDHEIVHIATYGMAPYVEPQYRDHFRHNALFIGANTREAVNADRADFTPINLSEVPRFIQSGRMPIDVALIQVAPSDKPGVYSLGVSVDVVRSAIQSARMVIAQINPLMPYTYGDSEIFEADIDFAWKCERAIPVGQFGEFSVAEQQVAQNVATLIDDGSTLQIGMGRTANAVAYALDQKNDLGIHTEMFSDGLMRLMKNGNANGRYKSVDRNRAICTQAFGSEELYEFLNKNPYISFLTVDQTNDPRKISAHSKMVSINNAIEVDLTGQVVGDCIGKYFHSGVGGQFDFTRGAGLAPDGLPIVAMTSTTYNAMGIEVSKVVCDPAPHAGVVTARGLVHYVVTEYGVADLYGKSIGQRALAMIEIAHPKFRQELLDQAKERGLISATQPIYSLDILQHPELFEHFKSNTGRDVTIRPILPSDEKALQHFFYSHSEKVIYLRYGFLKTAMHRAEAEERTKITQGENMVLIAVEPLGNRPGLSSYGSNVRGVARYIRLKNDPLVAEAAVTVDDQSHGQGIGKKLLNRLVEAAKKDGFKKLIFEIQRKNVGMTKLFERSFPNGVITTLDEDSLEGVVEI